MRRMMFILGTFSCVLAGLGCVSFSTLNAVTGTIVNTGMIGIGAVLLRLLPTLTQ